MDASTIRKALSMTEGAYLIPEEIDRAIRDYVSVQPVIYNVINKMPWATPTYIVRKKTALPTSWWGTDGANLEAATNSSFQMATLNVKYFYSRGEVTGPMVRAAGSLYNVLAMDIEDHSRTMVWDLSNAIATAVGDADDIMGIVHQVTTFTDFNDVQSIDAASAYLSTDLLDQLLEEAPTADTLLCSKATRREIGQILTEKQRFNDRIEISAGFKVLSYNDVPILVAPEYEDNTEIVAFRRGDAKVLVHEDFNRLELARTKDSTDYLIKGYFGFVLEGRPGRLHDFTFQYTA